MYNVHTQYTYPLNCLAHCAVVGEHLMKFVSKMDSAGESLPPSAMHHWAHKCQQLSTKLESSSSSYIKKMEGKGGMREHHQNNPRGFQPWIIVCLSLAHTAAVLYVLTCRRVLQWPLSAPEIKQFTTKLSWKWRTLTTRIITIYYCFVYISAVWLMGGHYQKYSTKKLIYKACNVERSLFYAMAMAKCYVCFSPPVQSRTNFDFFVQICCIDHIVPQMLFHEW